MVVAGDPSGVPACGGESGDPGKPVRSLKDGEVSARGTEEFGCEEGSEAGHTQQGPGVPVFGDLLADQRVQLGEFLIQGDDFLCEGGDDQFPEVLGRDGGVLGFRGVHGVHGVLGDRGGGAGTVFLQPRVDPGLAGAADPVRGPGVRRILHNMVPLADGDLLMAQGSEAATAGRCKISVRPGNRI